MVRRPTARKKMRARRQVCANVFGLQMEFNAPGLDELRVFINRPVVVNQHVQQVLRHAVATVLSSLVIPPQTLIGDLAVNHE
jgi:hypothetical protein